MAKQPKKPQTDYTRGGRDISNTAIPLYQNTLQQIADYNNDPTAAIDMYQEKYFTNTPTESDFIRNYQRAMGGLSANNYAATSGGYSSANQMNYDDNQRYYNDLVARLRAEGVAKSAAMAQQGYNNLLNATPVYNNAYGLGKEYSDVEQYNDMVDQINNNAWAGVVGSAGKVIGSIPLPWTMAIGGAMQGIGGMFEMDDSALRAYNNPRGGSSQAGYGQYGSNYQNTIGTGLTGLLSNYDWFNKNKISNLSK